MTHTHTASGKTTRTEVYTYTYDHADRISKVQHSLGSTAITLYDATYDNFGRLLTKQYHGTSTNKLTYTYNLRSWLTGISGTRFTQNLMTEDHKRLLAVFEVRVRDLMALCDQQKRRIDELTAALSLKDEELRQAKDMIEGLNAKCDNMLTVRIVSTNEEEMKNARMRLSKLVREVDKCIALLNE